MEGRRVVVTRSEPSDGPLSTELRNLGLPVLLWPAVAIEPTTNGPLEAALHEASTFDWIVFASRHAVAAVTTVLPSAPSGVRIAAVGQATAQVLRQRGWPVDLLPSEANAAALVAAFETAAAAGEIDCNTNSEIDRRANSGIARSANREIARERNDTRPETGERVANASGEHNASRAPRLRGRRILFPASSRALPTIAAGLTQLGAEVVQVEAYRTESSTSLDVEDCRTWIARGGIGAVTFASPSAVDELEHALGKHDFDRLLSSAAAVAIGPTTARALSDRGHMPTLAESATLQALAHAAHRLMQTSEADRPAAPEKL
jgi:uroporphyrinogen-III synthase